MLSLVGQGQRQGTTTPGTLAARPADRAPSAAWIRWVFPDRDGAGTRLDPAVTVLGRDEDCGASLASSQVSRRHAEIRWIGGIAMVRDLDSKNGLFLNQRRVTRAPLKPGDVLRLGDWIGIVTLLPADHPGAWRFEEVTTGYWAGPALLDRLAPARLAAASDLPIVIQGATGAGKEGAARSIHAWSGRSGPFLGLNCAALPEALAEGELFGYRKGAFTGADRANPGYLRAAHGGTLFLDEIVDLPSATQAKLLRAIEEREVLPLGEAKPVGIDVRLLAATQGSLRRAVDEKRFRGDLYARLDGFTLEIPPLRERVEEIPFLFRKLLDKHGGGAVPERGLDPLLVERLCVHDWPFNVRELSLLVRRLMALHGEAAVLEASMWPEPPAREEGGAPAEEPKPEKEKEREPEPEKDGRRGQELEMETFLAALRENRGNVKQTAAVLGISRGRAYRFMERIGELDLDVLRRPSGARPAPES
jgi:transcriptional regulator with AAA-type ATPase domain